MRRPRFPTRAYEDRVEPTIRMRITRCRRIDDRTGHKRDDRLHRDFCAWLRSAEASDLFGVNPARPGSRRPLKPGMGAGGSGCVRPAVRPLSGSWSGSRRASMPTWVELSGHPLASAGLPAVVPEPTRQGLAKPPGGLWALTGGSGAAKPLGADAGDDHDPLHFHGHL